MTTKQKLYNLKAQLKSKIEECKSLLDAGDLGETYKAADAECDRLEAEIAALEKQLKREDSIDDTVETEKSAAPAAADFVHTAGTLKGLKASTIKSFAGDVRKAMSEGTPANGGYTVPEDVVNRVYELVAAKDNLLPYITNTPVTTNSGKRTYKTRATLNGFATVNEMAKIPAAQEPTFAQIVYSIVKRAGYLPVSAELEEDSDENIASMVIEWLADEARVTINKEIVAAATGSGVTTKTGSKFDDIIEHLTKTLGSAVRSISTVHTNDSGLFWLMTLKDGNGRPLLQPDPTQPTRMMLGVGPVSVPLKVWDDATLPMASSAIPFLIGSLQEGIQRFDRKQITVTRLTEATLGTYNLAENDMVAFKAVMRDDCKLRDAGAFVYLKLTPAAGT